METTHEVHIGADRVTKRFRFAERGEPEREWRALELLQRSAPGLAPEPIEFRYDDGTGVIVMSRLPGEPLGSAPLTAAQTRGLASAVTTLHAAVPVDELASLPPRISGPAEMVAMLREEVASDPSVTAGVIGDAWRRGSDWIHSHEAAEWAAEPMSVFGAADGNLANFIWDGHRCRIVDFEDSGATDSAYELADLGEHLSGWLTGALDSEQFLKHLDLDDAMADRVHHARQVLALFWLWMLLPGNPGFERNPAGSADRQARRLLTLLD